VVYVNEIVKGEIAMKKDHTPSKEDLINDTDLSSLSIHSSRQKA
jgi:hypothetical protein